MPAPAALGTPGARAHGRERLAVGLPHSHIVSTGDPDHVRRALSSLARRPLPVRRRGRFRHSETGSLRIGDVDFVLSCGLGVFSECMQVNCDFGLSPDAQSGGGCADCCASTSWLTNSPGWANRSIWFRRLGSGRVLLMSALPLADLSGQKLATYLDTLAGQAIAWRQGRVA